MLLYFILLQRRMEECLQVGLFSGHERKERSPVSNDNVEIKVFKI